MWLNVGCGEWRADGWTNVDLHRDGPKPDVIGSIFNLPFPDESCERVYLGHVLEHLPLGHVIRAMREVRRVLTREGCVVIVGPDVNLARKHEPVLVDNIVAGGGRWKGDEHRWTASGGITLAHVTASGFAAWLLPVNEVPEPWPVVDRAALWQFAIEARKV